MTGIELIAKERQEQIEKHNRTVKYDAENNTDDQLVAGAAKLLPTDTLVSFSNIKEWVETSPRNWSSGTWWRMIRKGRVDRLVIAGALIAAEIDRLNYKGE